MKPHRLKIIQVNLTPKFKIISKHHKSSSLSNLMDMISISELFVQGI